MPIDRITLRLIYIRRVVVTLANVLGPGHAIAFARALARGVFDLNTPARARAEKAIQKAYPAMSAAQTSDLARGAFENIAAFWVEVFGFHRKMRESSWRGLVEVENEPLLQSVAGSGRGAIFVTAYLGSLAVASYALAQLLRPLYVVFDEVRHPVMKSWQDELYSQPNMRMLSRQEAQRQMAGLLSAGHKVLLVAEHSRTHGRAVEVPYLGRTCRCYPTVGLLSRWCDVPVIAVAARRLPGVFRFALSCEPVVDPREAADAEDLTKEVTFRTMRALESLVRRWPEQYLWTRIWGPEDLRTDEPPAKADG
jgi:Kdo2-lipid IVA lauroyltransferase/acyltransferase